MPLLVLCLALPLLAACDTLPESVRPPDPVDPDAVTVLATGTFESRGGQTTSGSYRLERVGADDLRLVLADDFRTDDGPDLHVVLSPRRAETVGDRTATDGSHIAAPVQARTGTQVYDLPDDLDVARFRSVLIHCVQYSHLFGAAPLDA